MGQTSGLVAGGLMMAVITLACLCSDVDAREFKINVHQGQHTFWRHSPPPKHRTTASPPPKRRPPPPPPSPEPPTPSDPREQNGVRLVLGEGTRGRLELSSTAGWLTDYEEGRVAWLPVCQMIGFDDSYAQIMCELLGYPYGRLYYSDEVAYRAANDTAGFADMPIENLSCSPNTPDAPPPSSEGEDPNSGGAGRHRRRLLAPLTADVDIPRNAPYACNFYSYGDKKCDYTGPLVGVECGDEEFPPAPPPPPRPPSPPNTPPARNVALKVYGNGPGTSADLESNLCNSEGSDPECPSSLRAEMLIDDPANPGSQIWAPICSVDSNDDLAFLAVDTLCKQAVNYPEPGYVSYYGEPKLPFVIPEEPDATAEGNLFRPSKYTNWVTLTGGEPNANYPAIQQMEYTVASSCDSGQLFAFYCAYADD